MVTYDLFGQHVSFDDSALRFFDLQDFFRKAKANADKSLDQWYKNCKNIEYVLDNQSDFAIDTVESLVIHPLFQQLREIGIYDLSEQLYERQCLDLSACAQALDQIESQYQSILQEQQQKYDYGATNELNPLNPDHVYNVIEDGSKTDEELSDREFEQKYGYFFGYCYDFGKSHATSSDPT